MRLGWLKTFSRSEVKGQVHSGTKCTSAAEACILSDAAPSRLAYVVRKWHRPIMLGVSSCTCFERIPFWRNDRRTFCNRM